jgi:hypothetical protein
MRSWPASSASCLAHSSTAPQRCCCRKACAKALRPLLRDDPALLDRLFSVASMEPLTPENRPADMPEFMLRLPGAFLIHDHRDSPEGREHAKIGELRGSAAFLTAALGLAGGVAEAARLARDYHSHPGPDDAELDAISGVLADRRPPWLADLIDRHLELQAGFPFGIPAWPLARRLVRLGAIGRPAARRTRPSCRGCCVAPPNSATTVGALPPRPRKNCSPTPACSTRRSGGCSPSLTRRRRWNG